jgi:predicted RNA-binding protein with TRAM domain
MASTYNSLGYQKMATGENAGTWGTKTNTTLDEIKETFGYTSIAMTADRTLTIPDGSTGTYDGRAFIIELTGTLGGTRVLDIAATAGDPAANIEKPFIVFDNTTHSGDTLTFKVTGQTGFALTEGSTYLCYHNGTDIINTGVGASTSPGGSTTQVQYNNSGAFGGDADLIWTAGTGLTINSQKELRLADTDDDKYIGFKSHTAVGTSYTLTWPQNAAAVNDYILTSQTDGTLAWVANSGGTSWQAVITADPTAVAGEGYFCNTTSAGFTVTLPAGTIGDEVSIVDYAGTFDTNNLTVAPNGSEKINGVAASLTCAVERAAFTLVFTDTTQGWLLKDK